MTRLMRDTHLEGARTHNLQRLSLDLREGELTVVTGVSGSGKSSLAMDTLYAEGQRRYIESFSPYARQFLERLERPPCDVLDPVPAGIAVDRRAPVKSSRSTVATMADLEAYLAALFTREAVPVCPDCHVPGVFTEPEAAAREIARALGTAKVIVTYPARATGTAEYLELRESLARDGYRRLLVGDTIRDLDEVRPSDVVLGRGEALVVVDRVDSRRSPARLAAAVEEAFRRGDGVARARAQDGAAETTVARGITCPRCARGFDPPTASLFSYQSPVGACATCRGFGRVIGVDWAKVIPDDSLSLKQGVLRCWTGKSSQWERKVLTKFCDKRGISMTAPWRTLTDAQRRAVLDGEGTWSGGRYPGVRAWFAWLEGRTYKMHVRVLLSRFRSYETCVDCGGARLNATALAYQVGGAHLAEWHALELGEAHAKLAALSTHTGQGKLAATELLSRLGFLEEVGLSYLTLDRQARTLSGGEAQRVSLTAALGSSLSGGLFVIDEPTVGLHATDVPPLTSALRSLSARGNQVLVVEHDAQIVASADRVLELGPGAGPHGGRLLFDGTPHDLAKRDDLPTGRALSAARATPNPSRHAHTSEEPRAAVPDALPPGTTAPSPLPRRPRGPRAHAVREPSRAVAAPAPRPGTGHLVVHGAREHNLVDLTVRFPIGAFTALTGPSGSGKSTLLRDILHRGIARQKGDVSVETPGAHDGISGLEAIREVVFVDQAPLGRTSRGNAATYTKAWDRLRARFSAEPLAVSRGLTPASFSFNVAGGRCEACSGEGSETVEMQFLADVVLACPSCHGKRFQPRVLEIRHAGLSVDEVLTRTVSEIRQLFADDRAIQRALQPVELLGLGYLPLGQPLSTLSGGEAQRLKLARALGAATPGTLFLLDEPSAGLHAEDVSHVLEAVGALVRGGSTVIVVDHDLDVVRAADWVVDLGPGAGKDGGRLVDEGTPTALQARGRGRTAEALRASHGARTPRPSASPRAPTPTSIHIEGAREHNLRDLTCDVPIGRLVVFTGPSGSGKSTLAFDVIFAEGQRRFLETLTPYARQFLPMLPRADVDRVIGVPPSVALEQRTTRAGSMSTVATVTEVAHHLRLLFAKIGELHCPRCDGLVTTRSPDEVYEELRRTPGTPTLLAVAVRARKGTYLDLFTAAARAGFPKAIVDGALVSTDDPPRLAKTKEHTIAIVVSEAARLRDLSRERFDAAVALGGGSFELQGRTNKVLSTSRACPACGEGLPELDPRWFSFHTKQGRCEACEGAGVEGGLEALDVEGAAPCRACAGSQLAPAPRGVRLAGRRYHEIVGLSVAAARALVASIHLAGRDAKLGDVALAELGRRLDFLAEVGLGYLALGRRAHTLSGGEMQRLRLAAQLGAGLTGALYVLDEPTIGLHPRDTARLLQNLRALVDLGSTVLVVEHDEDTIRAADHLVDLGPTGGRRGGRIVASGPPEAVLASPHSPTAQALAEPFAPPPPRPPTDDCLVLEGARAHNLRGVTLRVPKGRFVCVAGVSGSGKSTLVQRVLLPAVRKALGLATTPPGAFDTLSGLGSLRRAESVDQSPIGRTPRSVPATFLGVWDLVRRLYAESPDAKVAGFSPTRFSFNTGGGGRCPVCEGQGSITHEMSFLPDVVTPCSGCSGLRFEPRTLAVSYLGLSIGEVLRLSASEAVEHFHAHPKIRAPLAVLDDLGVGYLQLGQGSHTLSGGEAQRLKLAAELTAGARHEPTMYVLDEPTTGLHLADVSRLLAVLGRLVDRGDTLVVIEHHPRVLASADHLIELGPEGGDGGGRIVAAGTPREVAKKLTPTGAVLARLL